MDDRFLEHFESELEHIRSTAAEFARLYRDKSKTLFLDGESIDVADPYVERLLEGFAFIAARIQSKFDEQFPKVTQTLLQNVFPQFLAPIPSMTVVDLVPRDLSDDALVEGPRIARHTELLSHLPDGETNRCIFRTAHDVRLWPLRIAEAELHEDGLPSGYPPSETARSALSITLESTLNRRFDQLPDLDELTFFIRDLSDRDEGAYRLYELVFGGTTEIFLRERPSGGAAPGPAIRLGRSALGRVGFRDDESLLPVTRRGFQGYRLLREYFAFERRFLFFRLEGLARAMRQIGSDRLEIVFMIDGSTLGSGPDVSPSRFSLFATPAINVFERAAQVTPSESSPDYTVVPNRKDPLDYEVYEVQSVEAEGPTRSDRRVFDPFYAVRERGGAAEESSARRAYFTTYRVPRELTEAEYANDAPPAYRGTQVKLSLVEADGGPIAPQTRRLVVRSLCTNRDLVLRTPWARPDRVSFPTVQDAGPVSVRAYCLVPPSPPRPSVAVGDTAWRLVNHLSLNYLSLMDEDGSGSPEMLQDLLRLYAGHSSISDPDPRREDRLNQIAGLRSVRTRPIHHRFREGFVRGLGIELHFDEKHFLGGSAFLLGTVLDEFLAKYVSINAFTQTSVHSTSRGRMVRWPPRTGRRALL